MTPPARRRLVLDVLYNDDELVAVAKPARVLALPGPGSEINVPQLLADRPTEPVPGPLRPVHRLEPEASGVLLLARTATAQRALLAQMHAGEVEYVDLALVVGFVESDGEINRPLGYSRRQQRVCVSTRGKPARTAYTIRQRIAGNTLLEVRTRTDQLHQVRAHLAAIGHPLTVDPLYGGGQAVFLSHYKPDYRPKATREERPLIDRLSLHRERMSLRHPSDGHELALTAEPPKDFRATLSQLGRWG